MRKGFSLVEVTIIMAILGLVIGGIMAGRSMIRRSEVNSVVTDYRKYVTAFATFQGKYDALPGDFSTAVNYWSTTVSGDGDNMIEAAAGGGLTGEMFQFWNQLKLAGLISGSYSGLAGATNGLHSIALTNIPGSKLRNGGWGVVWYGKQSGSVTRFDGDYGHIFSFGITKPDDYPDMPILKTEEAWNIDKKLDDGNPGFGIVTAYKNTARTNCASTDDAATATYQLSNTTALACNLVFITGF